MNKTQFMRAGGRFARATHDANSELPNLSARIIAKRKDIVKYAVSQGFPETLSSTIARLFPKIQAEDICRAVRACASAGNKTLPGFKAVLIGMAKGMTK